MESFFIGIDAGGTKTEAVLCNQSGAVICKSVSGPSGVTGLERQSAFGELKKALTPFSDFIPENASVTGFAGISGCGAEQNRASYQEFFNTAFKGLGIKVGSDTECAMTAAFGREDGVIAVCGTGSIAVARVNGVMQSRVDGHGCFLGDESGGFALGRMALMAALREEDGRGPHTLLTELCRKKVGAESLIDVTFDKNKIASCAPCIFEAQKAGDKLANDLMNKAAANMALTIKTACKKLASTEKKVVITGSVWNSGEIYIRAVLKGLDGSYTLKKPDVPIAYGAVMEAGMQKGIYFDKTVRDTFLATYKNF